MMIAWNLKDKKLEPSINADGLPGITPQWLRSIASLALVIGVFSTICQALMFRFLLPIGDLSAHSNRDPYARSLSQKAFISAVGYAELGTAVPQDAVVQYNPEDQGRDRMSMIVNMLGDNHHVVIASDRGSCGSELGGDPTGCPILSKALEIIYDGATAERANTLCHEYGIQYLVARVYDPIWKDRNSWVWNLNPVVSDPDFRALECGR
jgi:hypothetical protein